MTRASDQLRSPGNADPVLHRTHIHRKRVGYFSLCCGLVLPCPITRSRKSDE